MQQRAPLFKGKRNDFVNFLADFVQGQRFRESICLTSSHAYERLGTFFLIIINKKFLSLNL